MTPSEKGTLDSSTPQVHEADAQTASYNPGVGLRGSNTRYLGTTSGHRSHVQTVDLSRQLMSHPVVKLKPEMGCRLGQHLQTFIGVGSKLLSHFHRWAYHCIGSRDCSVTLWDLQSCAAIELFTGHTDWVTDIRSIGGACLASASVDRTAILWRVADGQAIRTYSGRNDFVSLWLYLMETV